MLSAIFGEQFFLECYNPVGEVMDMAALVNSSINFILYYLMSSDFFKTLNKILGKKPPMINANKQDRKGLEVHSVSSKPFWLYLASGAQIIPFQ